MSSDRRTREKNDPITEGNFRECGIKKRFKPQFQIGILTARLWGGRGYNDRMNSLQNQLGRAHSFEVRGQTVIERRMICKKENGSSEKVPHEKMTYLSWRGDNDRRRGERRNEWPGKLKDRTQHVHRRLNFWKLRIWQRLEESMGEEEKSADRTGNTPTTLEIVLEHDLLTYQPISCTSQNHPFLVFWAHQNRCTRNPSANPPAKTPPEGSRGIP
jgi:hypothetical protein